MSMMRITADQGSVDLVWHLLPARLCPAGHSGTQARVLCVEGAGSMSAEQRKIGILARPLCGVRACLAEQAEVGVEFLDHYALVLRVEISDGVAPPGQCQHVNRPA